MLCYSQTFNLRTTVLETRELPRPASLADARFFGSCCRAPRILRNRVPLTLRRSSLTGYLRRHGQACDLHPSEDWASHASRNYLILLRSLRARQKASPLLRAASPLSID